jgi:hypothetical protein
MWTIGAVMSSVSEAAEKRNAREANGFVRDKLWQSYSRDTSSSSPWRARTKRKQRKKKTVSQPTKHEPKERLKKCTLETRNADKVSTSEDGLKSDSRLKLAQFGPTIAQNLCGSDDASFSALRTSTATFKPIWRGRAICDKTKDVHRCEVKHANEKCDKKIRKVVPEHQT